METAARASSNAQFLSVLRHLHRAPQQRTFVVNVRKDNASSSPIHDSLHEPVPTLVRNADKWRYTNLKCCSAMLTAVID
jgi:hypothetical protein